MMDLFSLALYFMEKKLWGKGVKAELQVENREEDSFARNFPDQ